ncbi:MAG: type IV pilus twitching motility protein PilT [bacterium]
MVEQTADSPRTTAVSGGEAKPQTGIEILLHEMVSRHASDLHLSVGTQPQLRIDGELVPMHYAPLNPEQTKGLCYEVFSFVKNHEEMINRLESKGEVDLSFGISRLARFRVNLFKQRGNISGAFRLIPFEIMSFEQLGLPPIVEELSTRPNGLILCTGATGSGKSTTLATMVDKINSEQHLHIITVEDPIEYLHKHKKSVIQQRQIETDTQSFAMALKMVLRQDPDVVLIGEMRDLETIETALTVAETGHLVLATLHTNSAASSISRIIDVFPASQQDQVRVQLSMVLQGVLAQKLIPSIGGGRVLALEILVATHAVRSIIRENKIHTLNSQMQVGSHHGMVTMTRALFDLAIDNRITKHDALLNSPDSEELQDMFSKQDY